MGRHHERHSIRRPGHTLGGAHAPVPRLAVRPGVIRAERLPLGVDFLGDADGVGGGGPAGVEGHVDYDLGYLLFRNTVV